MAAEKRFWTLDTARALLGEVRERTSRAVDGAESLLRERAREDENSAERAEIEQRIRDVVSRWAREMEALGVEVKGPWLVDFDNGSGYYCWKWPEHDVGHFHGYDEGFGGRVPIQ
jgi:hypothetical protein